MTISTTDLKIFLAQRNRDTADGGGAMSPNEVVDGEVNNVFDDVSSEDRVSGRVSARKVFPGVFSNNTDRFFGAGLLIIEPAHDDAVDVVMTRSTSYDDERRDIVNRIESYLVPGATMLWRLFNDHLQGTLALTLYAPSDVPTPDLGDTLFLEDPTGQQPREAVKIQRIVSRATQTFFDDGGSFQRDVLVLELTRPLLADWEGTEVLRRTTGTPPTRLRGSAVSAGARYYGVKRVVGDIESAALSVNIGNPFSRIVPSTNAESPVADERASLPGLSFAKAGADNAISVSTGSTSLSAGVPRSFFLGGTVFPGSVNISGTFTGEDNGDGTIEVSGSTYEVAVDYATGTVTVTRSTTGNVNLTLTATPGAAVEDSTLTVFVPVLQQTRALNYIRTLRPLPTPGTISVDYRALNVWYRLSDDARGTLSGRQPGEGGGTVNYATGSVTATLAALPDVGTLLIFSWGTGVTTSDGSTVIDAARPQFGFQIPNAPIVAGTLTFNYPSDGNTITITSNGANELLDGASKVGLYNANTGAVSFRPLANRWPDAGSQLIYTADFDQMLQENFTPTPVGLSDQVTITLAEPPRPGALQLEWLIEAQVEGRLRQIVMRAFDDGNGGLRYGNGATIPAASINYATGEVVLPAAFQVN